MAKATNPRKPAGDKRKGGPAAKRAAGERVTAARQLTVNVAAPRRPARVSGRPSGGRTLRRTPGPEISETDVRPGSGGGEVERAPAVPEAERVAPPLPVPIASFTF